MRLKMNALAVIGTIVLAASMSAQTPPDLAPAVISSGAAGFAAPPPKAGMVTMRVEDLDAEPVKGAPFCATMMTEHTQAFADGNRIHTSDNSTLCRDSEGRIRREAGLNLLGAAPQSSGAKLITIVDPVAGYRYMLDGDNKIAHRMAIASSSSAGAASINVAGQGLSAKREHVMIYQRVGTAGPNLSVNNNVFFKTAEPVADEPAPTTDNLGDQAIDGIHATGTRMTTTIPVGKMGNEQPILVTSERWYSPELKATVMTKHSDPWAGELKTQFTNVSTSEPDSSLFQVPSDYKVVDTKAGPFVIQKPSFSRPPAQ